MERHKVGELDKEICQVCVSSLYCCGGAGGWMDGQTGERDETEG